MLTSASEHNSKAINEYFNMVGKFGSAQKKTVEMLSLLCILLVIIDQHLHQKHYHWHIEYEVREIGEKQSAKRV